MKLSFRWYGEDDKVTLEQIRQIPGMDSIVTAVYDVPVGEVWSRESIAKLKKQTEAINEEAYERLDNIEETWLKKHMTGKKKTFMEQLYLRNQARAMAEEIVINEIVFKCR